MKKIAFYLGQLMLLAVAFNLHAQGTAFTYQGQLQSGGGPANGAFDFAFSLFNTNSTTNGQQIGGTVTNLDVGVTNGLFTIMLDFGSVFTGNAAWLSIEVQTNGGNGFTPLTPLQELTGSPYAIFAGGANAAGLTGTIAASNIANQSITSNLLALGAVGSNQLAPGFGLWSQAGNNLYYTAGNVGVGTNNPTGPLVVQGAGSEGLGAIVSVETAGAFYSSGIYGESLVPGANGVTGESDVPYPGISGPAAANVGVLGLTSSTNGTGVDGEATAGSGLTYGVIGQVFSPEGYAGYFLGNSYFSGNVGIGTTAPAAPLHVSSGGFPTALIDGSSVYGTWMDLRNTAASGTNWLVISTGPNNGQGPGKLVFCPGPNPSTTYPTVLTLEPGGNVGIGTNNPTAPLVVQGAGAAASAVIVGLQTSGSEAGSAIYGLSLLPNGNGLTGEADLTTNDGGFPAGVNAYSSATNGVGLYAGAWSFTGPTVAVEGIDSSPQGYAGYFQGRGYFSGNVGVGTTNPTAPLHVVGGNAYPHLIVAAAASAPFGAFLSIDATATTNGKDYLIYATGSSAGEGQGKLAFKNQTDGKVIMCLTSNGNVGIGTTSPQAGLDVETSSTITGQTWSYFDHGNSSLYYESGSTIGNNTYSGSPSVAIYTSGGMGAATYYAFSDARIKNFIGVSSGAADLNTLQAIEVADYTFKDVFAKGNTPQKKVVAQQVEKVFPQAVHKITGVVPDIYKESTVKDGWVQLATGLKAGERVKLIGEKEEGVHEVLEVRDGAFRTDFKPATEKVFVYGREVKDFRAVDYEAISMLNVSATQELSRRLENQAAEVRARDAKIDTLEKDNQQMQRELSEQKEVASQMQTQLIALQKAVARLADKSTVKLTLNETGAEAR